MKTSTLFRGLCHWLNPVTLTFLIMLLLMALATSAQAQNVNIPDPNFKAALLANASINTTIDSEITIEEAEAFSGTMDVSSLGITDLTGLEAFINLTEFTSTGNTITTADFSALVNLDRLILTNTALTSLDFSGNTLLTFANVNFNGSASSMSFAPSIDFISARHCGVTSFDASSLVNLRSLSFEVGELTSVNVANLPELNSLNLANNSLENIDLSGLDLSILSLGNNDFDVLDLSGLTLLNELEVFNNNLTTLNVSHMSNLEELHAANNQIVELDLRSNTKLEEVSVHNNSLTTLDLSNQNNSLITFFTATGNAELTCIRVSDVDFATSNWTSIDSGTSFSGTYCTTDDPVYIPDTFFKTALLANMAINTVDDGEVTVGEAEAFSGTILINQADGKVADLTGIEYFSNLEGLQMISHEISEFDATNHPNLRNITLPGNNLSEIDISTNPNLTFVNLQDNNISSINVDNNVRIRDLKLNKNLITEIDVTNLDLLTELTLGDNDLSEIDVTQNPDLIILDGYRNSLSQIDISQNTALKYLNLFGNSLTSINLSDQPDLLDLSVADNQLIALDLTVNDKLEELSAQSNSLTSLNLANGNNTAITSIDVSDNVDLSCVLVDDQAYSEANWADDFDEGVSFSDIYCDPNTPVNIPDDNFKAALLANANINTTADDEITYGEAEAYAGTLDVSVQDIADFTGLEAFINLIQFIADVNPATSINLSGNVELTHLKAYNVPFASIDLSNNTKLEVLSLGGNTTFSTIDLSNNTAITSLTLSGTDQITAIEGIENLTDLRFAYLFNNNLHSLDLSKAVSLVQLRAPNNDLSFLDMRNGNNENLSIFQVNGNSGLTCINVDNPNYFVGVWPLVDEGVTFKRACDPNDIINIPDDNFRAYLLANSAINTLDDGEIRAGEAEAFSGTILVNQADGKISDLTGIEYFSNLEGLQMISHEIGEFDATNHPNLRNIILPGNNLSEIDISANPNLTFVNLNDNEIASIDVDNNTNLRTLKLNNNLITEIDVTNLDLLTELTLGDNDLSEIDVTLNPGLIILDGYRNNLNSLDLSQNVSLKYMNFFGNNLTSIDLSDQPDLLELSIGDNQLTSIDLSQNTKLEDLRVMDNQLVSLDLSTNGLLEVLLAQDNSLSTLNLANGNNTAISSINISGNADLTCITVDEVAYAEANFTNVDEAANFSTDCSNVATDIVEFSLTEQVAPAVIDATAHTVVLEVPVDTDRSSLTPTIAVSVGASISPETGVAQDFSNVVTYTVTSQNPSVSQEWLVTVREENTAPSAIALDNNTITEGNAIDAIIGTFTTTDVDTEDTHTYTLVSGEGDTDNASFDISGSNLIAKSVFNFDSQTSHSIRIATDDGQGGTFEAQFTIAILDFTKSNQSITFPTIADQTYGDDRITLAATASSGLAVTYTITSGDDVVSLSGNRLTVEGVGDVTIRADQVGNATFNPSASVQRSFTVDPAILTITAESKQMTYGADLPALTTSYSGFVDNEDATDLTTLPTIITTATTTSNVGDFAITASGASADNYLFTYVDGTLSIGKAPLTVTANDQTMVYGDAVPELTVMYDGFVNGDDASAFTTLPEATTTAMSTSSIGNYPIAVTGAVASNYEITHVAGSLSVSQAMLTVTADDQEMIYGGDLPALTYTVSGLLNGDDASILTTPPTLTTTATSQSSVAAYDIIVVGALAANYTTEYVDGTLEVNKATLTATADDQEITFGDELPEFNYALSGFVNGDDLSVLDQLPVAGGSLNKDSDAGIYPIEVSGGSDDNYDFTYEGAELTIAKASAQISLGQVEFTADGQPKLPTITTDPEGLEVDVAINEGKDIPTEPGVYNVVITIVDPNYEGQISGTLTITEPDALGIEQHDLPTVFPNPTRNTFTVGKDASQIDRLVLFDLNGSKRKQVDFSNQIGVSELRGGVYLLWVYETDGTATYQKVIKKD